jgi:hypothetical protein
MQQYNITAPEMLLAPPREHAMMEVMRRILGVLSIACVMIVRPTATSTNNKGLHTIACQQHSIKTHGNLS